MISGLPISKLEKTLEEIRKILSSVNDPMVDDWDPILLGLLMAKLEYEDLDVGRQLENFSQMSAEVTKALPKQGSLREQTQHVVHMYKEVFGFGGDKANYYNIKNSFLNDVFLRRKGIPISLSLVFMGICRNVGLHAVGISFPGHFLVKMIPSQECLKREVVDDWRHQWFIDCFDGGSFMTVEECEKRLQEWTRGVIPFGPDALSVAHPTEILSRMLRNLRAIFSEKEDLPRLYWVLTALLELCPNDATEAFKDRGFLLARMGRFSAARKDLKTFLQNSRDVQKIQHVERILRHFETQSDETN